MNDNPEDDPDEMAHDHAAGLHVGETARRGFAGDLEGCDGCMDDEIATEQHAARLLATLRTHRVGYVDHFAARVIQDALTEAEPVCLERRAAALEAARPRPGDYPGRATPDELKERHHILTNLADTYRTRAREMSS